MWPVHQKDPVLNIRPERPSHDLELPSPTGAAPCNFSTLYLSTRRPVRPSFDLMLPELLEKSPFASLSTTSSPCWLSLAFHSPPSIATRSFPLSYHRFPLLPVSSKSIHLRSLASARHADRKVHHRHLHPRRKDPSKQTRNETDFLLNKQTPRFYANRRLRLWCMQRADHFTAPLFWLVDQLAIAPSMVHQHRCEAGPTTLAAP